jgi:hypothetical protein
MFLLGILIFKRLTARRFYKSFRVKGLKHLSNSPETALSNTYPNTANIITGIC